jgi:hypothetical protein
VTLPKVMRGRAWKFGAKERRGGGPPLRRLPLGLGPTLAAPSVGGRPAEPGDAELPS